MFISNFIGCEYLGLNVGSFYWQRENCTCFDCQIFHNYCGLGMGAYFVKFTLSMCDDVGD